MSKLRFILSVSLYLLFSTACLYAQTTDTVQVYSTSMKKEIPNIVILPASYFHHPQTMYPVVYLLHGYGGNFSTWATYTKPDLDQVASRLELIIVCPDGANSWYWDSPADSSYRYETYASKELVHYIDTHYRTIKSRQGRAVTGFSMGGHGGLWLGFRHNDVFGACGSMSGGVDIRPFPSNWEMDKRLGNYDSHKTSWEQHTVINQLPDNLAQKPLAIIIDCGTEDFFYEVNCSLHTKLLQNHIPHDFIIRPGKHNHAYWNNAIDYQLLFFRKAFDSGKHN